jgi:hypothetical protein
VFAESQTELEVKESEAQTFIAQADKDTSTEQKKYFDVDVQTEHSANFASVDVQTDEIVIKEKNEHVVETKSVHIQTLKTKVLQRTVGFQIDSGSEFKKVLKTTTTQTQVKTKECLSQTEQAEYVETQCQTINNDLKESEVQTTIVHFSVTEVQTTILQQKDSDCQTFTEMLDGEVQTIIKQFCEMDA